MKSNLPKVLHLIGGLPMLGHTLTAVKEAGMEQSIIVLSPNQETVSDFAAQFSPNTNFVIQQQQNGTGDAVKAAMPLPKNIKRVVVMFGDTPLMQAETLKKLLNAPEQLAVLGFTPDNPAGYGRILLSKEHTPVEIIEHKDTSKTHQISLCNGGAMAVDREILERCLGKLGNDNAQGEYYLPDLVRLAVEEGFSTGLIMSDPSDTIGVDSRAGLAKAEALFQTRQRQYFMEQGVTLIAPSTVFFSHDTQIAPDVIIEPHCIFAPKVNLARGCVIKAFSHLEGSVIGKNSVIGPYARLRHGTQIEAGAKIGNFVEIKETTIGKDAKVNHLSYMGDAQIGESANIGAGTITCNYDGFNKHKTEIGAGAFIGSNSSLIAPLKIGAGAYIGSSSVLSNNVEADALAITRAPVRNIMGWARKFRSKNTK